MTHAQRFWFHLSEVRPEDLFITVFRRLDTGGCSMSQGRRRGSETRSAPPGGVSMRIFSILYQLASSQLLDSFTIGPASPSETHGPEMPVGEAAQLKMTVSNHSPCPPDGHAGADFEIHHEGAQSFSINTANPPAEKHRGC